VNDDGIESELLLPFQRQLEQNAVVNVIVPSLDRSLVSHSVRYNQVIILEQVDKFIHTIDSYPADCVIAGLSYDIFPSFDLIVSGINLGVNLGYDWVYSGTVAAAREGAINQYMSIAISCEGWSNIGLKRLLVTAEKSLYEALKIAKRFKTPVYASINIPDRPIGDIKLLKEVIPNRDLYNLQCNANPIAANLTELTLTGTRKPLTTSRDDIYWFNQGWVTVSFFEIN